MGGGTGVAVPSTNETGKTGNESSKLRKFIFANETKHV